MERGGDEKNEEAVICGFLIWKPAIFRKVKEIRHLSGGVALYAAQSNAQIDAEIAEKDGFRTETTHTPDPAPDQVS